MDIDSLQNFKPTRDQINALPEGLRKYIFSLETLCDPSGIVAENMIVKDMLIMLGATNAKLRAELEGKENHHDEGMSQYEKEQDEHIKHGGWKCAYCGFDGQDNVQANVFCVECHRHK